jgi:hypothetical protein
VRKTSRMVMPCWFSPRVDVKLVSRVVLTEEIGQLSLACWRVMKVRYAIDCDRSS